MEEFVTILNNQTAEITEKKSKFIANIFYIENEKDAEEKIKLNKKKYYDAKHNCIAYRVIEDGKIVERSSDDGEPSGTAGAPMLNLLQKNNLCNVLVIVTRYFGGILLGTGGLVRAYSDVTQSVIERTTKIFKVCGVEFNVKIDYANLDIFKYYCKNNEINIIKIDYGEDINLKIEMEKNRKDILIEEIKEKMQNTIKIDILEDKYIEKN